MVEPTESNAKGPDLFMHKYANGKRGYKSFKCTGCQAITRVDKMKTKGTWKCYECLKPASDVLRDSKGNEKVSGDD